MSLIRCIVCGGRDFNKSDLLDRALNYYLNKYPRVEIVSGHARGADALGETYAICHNRPCRTFPADWNKYGKRAGYIRNKQMLDYAVQETPFVIAFWDGKSRGTKMMIDLAVEAGVAVRVVRYK